MHLTIGYLGKSRFLDKTNRVKLYHNEVYVLFLRFRRTFFKTLMQEIQEVEAEHVSASVLWRNLQVSVCVYTDLHPQFLCVFCVMFFFAVLSTQVNPSQVT